MIQLFDIYMQKDNKNQWKKKKKSTNLYLV